jgi:glycosyltransferase involved in cell wall biosynthesis
VRLFRAARPLVVHTHTAKAGTVGRIAAAIAGVPVRVHTFHGHVFRGYFSGWKSRLFIGIERALARITTRVIAISPRQADELVDEFRICPRNKVRVIPLGLELDRFAPERSEPLRTPFREEIGAGSRPVITCVGRLVPIKNHDLFLELAAALTRQGHDCLFLIVGGGGEEPRLRRRVEALELSAQVRFLGWRSDLDRIYAGSDLVVLTSHNEGTPVCLIEALAAGCPVVATDVGGVRDVLEDGALGVLVPSDDAAALTLAVMTLIDSVCERTEMGRRGARSVATRYDVTRLADDITALYDELTLSSRSSAASQSPPVA